MNTCEKNISTSNKTRVFDDFWNIKILLFSLSTRPADKRAGGLMIRPRDKLDSGTLEITSRSSFSIFGESLSSGDVLDPLDSQMEIKTA